MLSRNPVRVKDQNDIATVASGFDILARLHDIFDDPGYFVAEDAWLLRRIR